MVHHPLEDLFHLTADLEQQVATVLDLIDGVVVAEMRPFLFLDV